MCASLSFGLWAAVYRLLEEKRGLKILEDPHIYVATQEILPDPGKTRNQASQSQPLTTAEGFRSLVFH